VGGGQQGGPAWRSGDEGVEAFGIRSDQANDRREGLDVDHSTCASSASWCVRTDTLFDAPGARIGSTRIRRGIDDATRAAGLVGPTRQPLRITPHQLRHTYATSLVDAV